MSEEKLCRNKTTKTDEKKFIIINDGEYYKVKDVTCEYCHKTNTTGWKWLPKTLTFPHTKLIRCDTCFNQRFNL